MTIFGRIFSALRGRQAPPPLSSPPKPKPNEMHVVVKDINGKAREKIVGSLTVVSSKAKIDGYPLSYYMLSFDGYIPWGTEVMLLISADGCKETPYATTFQPNFNVNLPLAQAPARQGQVSSLGRCFADAGGIFNPLGATLFWAVGGYHRGDIARAREHFKFLREEGKQDYVRILAEVNWEGEEIDPNWPDYPATLAAVVDAAYDDFGMRSHVTIIGGTTNGRARWIAARVRAVLAARTAKVIFVESVNEGNASQDDAIQIAQEFAGSGILVGVGLGDQGRETINACSRAAGAPVKFVHTERSLGDKHEPGGEDARPVRQPWNFEAMSGPCVNGEPPGPASSVAELTDPFKLATMRALSIVCGAAAFCFHAGALVFGRKHISNNGKLREANIWEVPNIKAMLVAVRNADLRLPVDVANWEKFNKDQPVQTLDRQCNKHYGAKSGNRFVSIAFGCDDPIDLIKKVPVDFEVFNIATGESLGKNITKASGLWAYLIVGTLR